MLGTTGLQGTAVGMSLFYTDLLAKLWLLITSAPRLVGVIPGFKFIQNTAPRVPAQYWAEMNKLNATRVWFGPRAEGYSYPGKPRDQPVTHLDEGVVPPALTHCTPMQRQCRRKANRQIITWWDRHYAALASLEPQFHLQNQIAKWSIVTGLLSEQGCCHSSRRFQSSARTASITGIANTPSQAFAETSACWNRRSGQAARSAWSAFDPIAMNGEADKGAILRRCVLPKAESLLENRLATTLSRPQQRGRSLQAGLLKSARETLFRLQPAQRKPIVVMANAGPKTCLRGPAATFQPRR